MEKIANQHGDVFLVLIDEIPLGAKEIKINNGWVLERGEGVHTHCIDDISGVKVYEKDGDIFVQVDKATTLSHEEHGVQILQPGIHKKKVERVWDYEKEEARQVID